MPFVHIAKSLGSLGERVGTIDDGRDLAGLNQSPQDLEIPGLHPRGERLQRLAGEERHHRRPQHLPVEPPEPLVAAFTADDDERPALSRGAAKILQRPPSRRVENEIVVARAVAEILAGAVDHVIGAIPADQVDLRRAANARHLGAERLGELHRERAHATTRADDQHLLPRQHPALVAQTLERRDARDRHRRRLLEGEVGRFGRQATGRHGHVLGERAVAAGLATVDLVARPELPHVLADRLDAPRDVVARYARPGRAQPQSHEAHQVGQTGRQVPHAGIDARRAHAHQHLVVAGHRSFDLAQVQNLGWAVRVLHDRPHRSPSCRGAPRSSLIGRGGA